MYRYLKDLFNSRISQLHGNDFQSFLDEVFKLFYGAENYSPLRKQRDKGNDGCLRDKSMIFAMYSPETTKTFQEVKHKFDSDLQKYRDNWSNYENFTFIYNNPEPNINVRLAAELQLLANENNADFWTRGYVIDSIIGKLSLSSIRELAIDALRIDEYQYTFSIIKWVVADLTKPHDDKGNNTIDYKFPTDLDHKIKKNFQSEKIASVKQRVLNFVKDFLHLKEILKDEETAKILKNKVLQSYEDSNAQETFENRIEIMKRNLSHESRDDSYLFYVECIIFYIFEQCLIGER